MVLLRLVDSCRLFTHIIQGCFNCVWGNSMNTQLQEKQPWWISLELVGIKQLQNTKLHWRHMRVMESQITGISGLFVQQPLPVNSKPPNDLPSMRRNQRWPVDSSSQRDSNAENVYMSWCHNELDRILSVFLLVSPMSALNQDLHIIIMEKIYSLPT